jgi:hypothetical protein
MKIVQLMIQDVRCEAREIEKKSDIEQCRAFQRLRPSGLTNAVMDS